MKAIFISAIFLSSAAFALTPLKGLIKGDTREIKQVDPLRGLFSKDFYTGLELNEAQRSKIEMQKAVYGLGSGLANKCKLERYYTYDSVWSEQTAKRSIVATLQFLGIDIASKAIAKYSRDFDLSEEEFMRMANNLVVNTCSENISVYSKKLIKNNLIKFWEEGSEFEPPSFGDSPYVASGVLEKTNSYESKKREFNFALKNFRDFCSWDGDVDNYRMLAPYLRNPFLMAMVYTQILEKKLEYSSEQKTVVVNDIKGKSLVACEDLICRQRDRAAFHRIFPRMVGSVDLTDDLETLYCGHFRDVTLKTRGAPEKVKKWINEQGLEEGVISPLNFLALLSGVPDFFLSADRYKDIAKMHSQTVEKKWDLWAKNQTDQLVLDLLYEESLYVDLVKATQEEEAVPDSGLTFDFTLGELDRELKVVDKLSAKFSLKLPEKYLAWLKRSYISASNKSDYAQMQKLKGMFQAYLDVQLKTKKKYFETAVWNEDFSEIIANELVRRLTLNGGKQYDALSQEMIEVPIKFRFGLFAMKYLRDKFQAKSQFAP